MAIRPLNPVGVDRYVKPPTLKLAAEHYSSFNIFFVESMTGSVILPLLTPSEQPLLPPAFLPLTAWCSNGNIS